MSRPRTLPLGFAALNAALVEEVADWLLENERSISWLARKAGIEGTWLWKSLKRDRPLKLDEVAAISRAMGMNASDLLRVAEDRVPL